MKKIGCGIVALLFIVLLGLCGLWIWSLRLGANGQHVRTGHTLAADMPLVKFPPRGAYRHPWKITDDYDRFKNYTNVRMEIPLAQLSSKAQVWFSDAYEGKSRLRTADHLTFTFYPYATDFSVLVHGEPVIVYHEPAIVAGSDCSFYTIAMADVVNMLASSNVECRLGETEFRFTPEQLEAMRDWVSRLTP